MKRVHLIRHGEQVQSIHDPNLNDLGRRQAEAVAKYLRRISPDGIAGLHASTQNRAYQTAQAIQTEFGGVPIFSNPELVEKKIVLSTYESMEQFYGDWTRSLRERDWKTPHGESGREAGNRLDAQLQELPDHKLPYIVVAHGGIIADWLRNRFEGSYVDQFRPGFSEIGQGGGGGLKHTSVTTVVIEGQNHTIEGVDSVKHLEGIGLTEGWRPIMERK